MTTAPERQELPIGKATFKELKEFATEDMGITIENGWNSAKIKLTLKESGWEHEFILGPKIEVSPVQSDAAPPEPQDEDEQDPLDDPQDDDAPPLQLVKPRKVPEPVYTIEVGESEGAGGKRPYYVGVNGIGILLPRNRPIPVKRRYVEALKSAKNISMVLDEESGKMEERTIWSLPFQIMQSPSPDNIKAWLAWESYSDLKEHALVKANERAIRERERERA